jgi:hypothetical protein
MATMPACVAPACGAGSDLDCATSATGHGSAAHNDGAATALAAAHQRAGSGHRLQSLSHPRCWTAPPEAEFLRTFEFPALERKYRCLSPPLEKQQCS